MERGRVDHMEKSVEERGRFCSEGYSSRWQRDV
jgi:hypothetical protein